MHKLLLGFLLIFSSMLATAQDEKVYTFHSDIRIDTSGVIAVREHIRVYAKGDVFKRGITRSLPLSRRDGDGNRIRVNYNVTEVLQDGSPVNFFTQNEGGNLTIYVGEREKFLQPGFYSYEILYETAGQIGFFADYDELSWNVNGESDKTTDKVSATLRLPENADAISFRCYTGRYGSTESNCQSDTLPDGSLYFEAVNLAANETLTVSAGFTKGIVTQPVPPKPRELTFFDKNGLPILSIIVLLLLLSYYFFTWRKYGIDPPKPVAIPQFSPPEGLSPASVGMLHKEKYNNDFITGSLVNLAVKGFIRIKETEERGGIFGQRKDRRYTLIKLKDGDNTLPKEESVVMRDLFRTKNEVKLTGEYNEDVANMMRSFRGDLNRQYTPVLREGLNLKFHVLPWILMVLYSFSLAYFVTFEPMEQVISFFAVAVLSFVVLFMLSLILRKIFAKSKIKWFSYVFGGALVIGAIALLFTFSSNSLSVNAVAFIVAFPLIIISYLAYAYLIKRPGERKLHYQSLVEGLKMYIDTAEEKQLQYFNPPQVTPEVFETLLPYAIVMDMEEVWGEKFEKSFLSAMVQPEPYQPPWFSGNVLRPAYFGHVLNSTLSNTVNHAAIKPVETSSGGGNWGSGSFGGGFSGMGGGGGSVGGW